MSYSGKERRVVQILATRNVEYHMRGNVCVAVRDLESGQMITTHSAIGSKVQGRMTQDRHGCWRLDEDVLPSVGGRLLFTSRVLTAPLRSITRPQRMAQSV